MKQFRTFFVMTLMSLSSVAMAQTTVKGMLIDETLGESEPYATVRVFKAGKSEKPVAMFLTDENGQFSQEVKGKGKFDIVFSSIGKEDLKKSVELEGKGVLNLDTLYIKENATMLKGVEIVAQKPLVKMDVKWNFSWDEADEAVSDFMRLLEDRFS